jgi:hypothetical protein
MGWAQLGQFETGKVIMPAILKVYTGKGWHVSDISLK